MVTNMVLNIILVFPLAHAGLALATTLSACLNATLLFRGLRREGVYHPESSWGWLLLRGVVASVAMGLLLYWGAGSLDSWLERGIWERALALLGWIAAGGAIYFVVLYMLGIRQHHFMAQDAIKTGT
jgi:putative peptidoglycan lipid II flippase